MPDTFALSLRPRGRFCKMMFDCASRQAPDTYENAVNEQSSVEQVIPSAVSGNPEHSWQVLLIIILDAR
jgi:hypothetical protein